MSVKQGRGRVRRVQLALPNSVHFTSAHSAGPGEGPGGRLALCRAEGRGSGGHRRFAQLPEGTLRDAAALYGEMDKEEQRLKELSDTFPHAGDSKTADDIRQLAFLMDDWERWIQTAVIGGDRKASPAPDIGLASDLHHRSRRLCSRLLRKEGAMRRALHQAVRPS